jgi:small-conductance mechanosensitive channel
MSVGMILKACLLVYLGSILIELALTRRAKRFLVEVGALAAVVIIALFLANAVTGRVAFGEGMSPLATVAWMFAATLLGIAARYVFYLQKGQFTWLDLVKPMAISPIVVLPLLGSVQTAGELKSMQVVSFAFIAFQNGFFWQTVLEAARPSAPAAVSAGR